MSSIPNLLGRHPNQIDLSVCNDPNFLRYRFLGHRELNGAFLTSVEMFTVEQGVVFRSDTIIAKGLGLVDESIRGLTKAIFDLDDFQPTNPNLPFDNQTLYLRIEEFSIAANAFLPAGPIYIIPPAKLFGVSGSMVNIYGSAPAGTGAAAGSLPPADVMHISLPSYSSGLFLRNLDSTEDLLVSFDAGQPMFPVPSSVDRPFFEIDNGTVSDLFLASDHAANVADFSAIFSLTKT